MRAMLRAVAISSLLFALVHPTHLLAAGLGGLVLACVRRRTGSLRACVAVHALYNVLVSWPLLGQWLFAPRTGDLAAASTWALPLGCLALALVTLPTCLWVARRPLDAASGPSTPA